MKKKLPEGSKIRIDQSNVHRIIIPHGSASILRCFIGLFIFFWLGGWFFGFKSVAPQVFRGEGDGFQMFWLGGWIIGGIVTAYFLFRILRPSVSESLVLLPSGIKYDSGRPPFQIHFNFINQREVWGSLFPKRIKTEINRDQIKTLSLKETDSGNRLTVDMGSKRIDIGVAATEIEREWLFESLKYQYF